MREIIFRGKCKRTNRWVFGYLSNKDVINTDKGRLKVIPETVSQFTGLLDKNGNKIFENDIVKVYGKPYESKEPIVVVWGKKSYGWSLKFNCGNHYEHKPLIKYYSLPSSRNIEIIGNIHDSNDKN